MVDSLFVVGYDAVCSCTKRFSGYFAKALEAQIRDISAIGHYTSEGHENAMSGLREHIVGNPDHKLQTIEKKWVNNKEWKILHEKFVAGSRREKAR